MARRRKYFKVVRSALGRQGVWGIAHIGDMIIEIDRKLKGAAELEKLIHEAQHHINPEMSEEDVESWSIILTRMLWAEGYRKIDNDTKMKFQDGSRVDD